MKVRKRDRVRSSNTLNAWEVRYETACEVPLAEQVFHRLKRKRYGLREAQTKKRKRQPPHFAAPLTAEHILTDKNEIKSGTSDKVYYVF